MNDLVLEGFWKQFTLVHADAGGRAVTGLEEVRYDTGIVLVPVIERPLFLVRAFGLGFLPTDAPGRAGHFIGKAVVAELHHVIDAHAAIAIVVIIGLPERPE